MKSCNGSLGLQGSGLARKTHLGPVFKFTPFSVFSKFSLFTQFSVVSSPCLLYSICSPCSPPSLSAHSSLCCQSSPCSPSSLCFLFSQIWACFLYPICCSLCSPRSEPVVQVHPCTFPLFPKCSLFSELSQFSILNLIVPFSLFMVEAVTRKSHNSGS